MTAPLARVVHSIPGRARLRAAGIKGDRSALSELQSALEDAPRVKNVQVNVTTGSLVVEQPALVMRIGTMIKQLLDEVRSSNLDEASRTRLRDIHARSIQELERGLAPELIEELERITLPPAPDEL